MKSYLTYLLLLVAPYLNNYSLGQELNEFNSTIRQMGLLESQNDAKCHATASRLEDFIYGTPLSFSARNKRIDFQKKYVKNLWLDYTKAVASNGKNVNQLELFKQIEKKYFKYQTDDSGIQLSYSNGHQVFIPQRDYRQYSSVAYAFRAIIAVQQSFLFETESLASLEPAVMNYFKKSVDLTVLALLHQADQFARNARQTTISEQQITKAVKVLFNNFENNQSVSIFKQNNEVNQQAIIEEIITQKLTAYQKYNQINQSVFLRNIQVYFSKVRWPVDPITSKEMTGFYTNLMIQFTGDLIEHASQISSKRNNPILTYSDIHQTIQTYLPHSINSFEDVTYFPNIKKDQQIIIESYDLDAFRDSGLHWQYLKYVLADNDKALSMGIDPFALELLVEGIAQFGVVVFRLGGQATKKQPAEVLTIAHLKEGLSEFQSRLTAPKTDPRSATAKIVSQKNKGNVNTSVPFTEITDQINLEFNHRNSDWLSRTIRSYSVLEKENTARIAIPPAFSGSGVAAEDIDNDGWVDLLLLGGKGNKLFKNIKGEKFVDITDQAGLNWQRKDGNYGEPRQPILVDFDNDGWQDIFISYANDAHRIYRNNGDGSFTDLTNQAGLGGKGLIGGPATSFDYDKDGLLDLYIGYFGNYPKGDLPSLKRHNTNGGANKLFKNLGGFKFVEVSKKSGTDNTGWTQAVGHTDIDGDGWQDLIVGNDFGINAYYRNNQDGTFSDISKKLGTDKPSYTMNIGISDLNRDERPDFYISNIVVMEKDDKYVLPNEHTTAHFDPNSLKTMRVVEANDLFLSSTDQSGSILFEKSKSVGRGYNATGWSWDADFFDFDNDGDDDLYCLTGMNPYSVYGTDNAYYQGAEGQKKDVQFYQSNADANVFFENKDGGLNLLSTTGGLNYKGTSRSAAYFDMDQDGDSDIIINEYQGSAKIFKNNAEKNSNNWVKIKLVGDPKNQMSRDAIGATITLKTVKGDTQWKEVYSTTGYLSAHPKWIHFGLGDQQDFDIEIKWPNGHVQQTNKMKANKLHSIKYNTN